MTFSSILPYIQIGLSVLLVLAVVLQQSEAGLGGAFGGSRFGGVHYTRRGAEKILFKATIILGTLFVLASILALIV